MGTTANLKLPYPESGDGADGPAAFVALAQKIEDYFFTRALPTGVTRMPNYYWGTVATFPTSVMPGDTCTLTGALWVYTGSGWANAGRQTFVSSTDPGSVPDGSIWFQPAS